MPDSSPAQTPARDPWIDNARFVLIALVVFGHALEPLLEHHAVLRVVYRFVYLFHMPTFALLSGALSSATMDGSWLRKIVFRLLLPYLAFQGLYALAAQSPLWPDDGPSGIATPYWLLWYLPSLACWRLLLPLFARLRYRMVLAFVIALAAGWAGDLGYYLSLSRTLVFFPFFLLGWQVIGAWREQVPKRRVRLGALAVLAGLGALACSERMDPRWLYGSVGYAALHIGAFHGALYRLLQLLAASTAALAFLALMPQRTVQWSTLGRGSLAAYLLHGFLVKLAIGAGFFVLLRYWPSGALLGVLGVGAVAIAAALSTPMVNQALAPIASPRWLERWLWRPR